MCSSSKVHFLGGKKKQLELGYVLDAHNDNKRIIFTSSSCQKTSPTSQRFLRPPQGHHNPREAGLSDAVKS
jgi:hypothetical protein